MAVAIKNRITKLSANGNGKTTETVKLKPLQIKTFKVKLVGTSPLITHPFAEKQRKSIEDKQGGKAKEKSIRDPHAEYLAAHYVMPGSPPAGQPKARYGVPAAGIKNAAVSACRYSDSMPMTVARGSFFVKEDAGGLIELQYDETRMRTDTVRLSGPGGTLDLRYRPEFIGWRLTATIEYNASVTTPEQIIQLLNIAGFGVGLCEMRPEKSGQGYGQFSVQSSA